MRARSPGRRTQAAFTIKELRECTRLEGVTFRVSEAELAKGRLGASGEELVTVRGKQRIDQLLGTSARVRAQPVVPPAARVCERSQVLQ